MEIAEIMVVDDTLANLRLVRQFLSGERFNIRPFPRPLAALEAADHRRPDLVLLDVLMPDIDGYEWCRRFRQNPDNQDVPVVFVSALSDAVDKVKAFERGGVDFLTKPFSAPELEARVLLHLELSRMRREAVARSEQLEATLAEVRLLEESRQLITQTIVHDLKNPLASILMNAQFVRDCSPEAPAPTLAAVADIILGAERSMDLLMDVLDVARGEATGLDVTAQPVDVAALCRAAATDTARAAGVDGRVVTVLAPTELLFPVDAELIRRVIVNLVENGLKYSPNGKPVSVEVTAGSDTGLHIAVSDSGPGVSPEQSEAIFEPFIRLPREGDAHSRRSAGLGLAFCKLAVEAHGGRIRCLPAAAGGASFSVCLPAPGADPSPRRSA